jgi:serine/threonine-protein kinase RsbW
MLALRSNPQFPSVVRGAVEGLTETLGFPAEQCRAITRAVDEALTNIVRHCYGNRHDQPIALYFRRAQRRNDGVFNRASKYFCATGVRQLTRASSTGGHSMK